MESKRQILGCTGLQDLWNRPLAAGSKPKELEISVYLRSIRGIRNFTCVGLMLLQLSWCRRSRISSRGSAFTIRVICGDMTFEVIIIMSLARQGFRMASNLMYSTSGQNYEVRIRRGLLLASPLERRSSQIRILWRYCFDGRKVRGVPIDTGDYGGRG